MKNTLEQVNFEVRDLSKIRNYKLDATVRTVAPGDLLVMDTATGKLKKVTNETVTAATAWKFFFAHSWTGNMYEGSVAAVPVADLFEGTYGLAIALNAGDCLTIKAGALVKAVATDYCIAVVTKANKWASGDAKNTAISTIGARFEV